MYTSSFPPVGLRPFSSFRSSDALTSHLFSSVSKGIDASPMNIGLRNKDRDWYNEQRNG